MIRQLKELALDQFRHRVLGDGLMGELAGRGISYLGDNVREALRHADESVSSVRLEPGERYTVIARPAPTRAERKLSDRERTLREQHRRASRPSRAQLKAARRLARTQRRLDRTKPGSRRSRRLERRERRRGARFDRVMTPTKKQAKLSASLERTSAELAERRATSFAKARAGRTGGSRRPRVTVYD